MNDTRPANTPAALLPDEECWRRLAACLARRAQALRDPAELARQQFQRAEILSFELRDDEAARHAYEATLDAWPAHLPAFLALRDMAVGRDDPALAAQLFDRLEDLLRAGLDNRDRAELTQSFLLLWVFRWRDAARAGRAAQWVESTEGGPEILALLEPLLSDPATRRVRLEGRVGRLGDAESKRMLGLLLADELGEREAGLRWLEEAAPLDAMAAWRLLEDAAFRRDDAALAERLEGLTSFVPPHVAGALRYLAAEIWELRLGDPLRADMLYGQARGGTLHAAVGLKRVVSAVPEGHSALLRRLSEESEQLGDVGLDRIFAVRAMHLAVTRGDDAATERVARQVLARYPDEQDASELVERLCYQSRRWQALATEWESHREPAPTTTGERPVPSERALRLCLGALHEHARFDPDAALLAVVRRTASGAPRAERDVTLLRALQRLATGAAPAERVRAWQYEADVSEQPERRADLFLKIGRTLLRHTNEHEKALTYLFWVLDLQPENLTALKLIETVCRARGSHKPLAEILARELPLIDRPEERFPLARELAQLHELQEGDLERAIERYEQALADQPGDAPTAADLQRLYTRAERHTDLRAFWVDRLRLKLAPGERAEIQLGLGELAEQHFRDHAGARNWFEQAQATARLPGAAPSLRRAAEQALLRLAQARITPAPTPAPASEPEAVEEPLSLQPEDLLIEEAESEEPTAAVGLAIAGPEPEAEGEPTRLDAAPVMARILPSGLPKIPSDPGLKPLPTPSPALRVHGPGSLPPLPRLPPRRPTPESLPAVDASVDAPEPFDDDERAVPAGPRRPWDEGQEMARAPEADPGRAVVARKLRRAASDEAWPEFGLPALHEAVAALGRAVEVEEKAESAARLAAAYEEAGQSAAAVRAWRAVLSWRAGDSTAEARLAELYPVLGDHAALAELRARQAERTGDRARRHALRLEAIQLHLGPLADPVGAVPILRAAAEERASLEAGEAIARGLTASGAWASLREVLALMHRAQPTPARAGELGRLLLHRLNRPEEALPHLEAAAQADPEMRVDLALCRAALGNTDAALGLLSDGVLSQSSRPSVKLHLARLLERQGADPELVRRLYLDALEAGEREPELLDNLEQLAVAQKDWALLVRVVETQLGIAPEERPDEVRDLAVRLGHLYYKRLDRPLEAAKAFIRAWKLQPGDLSLYRVIEGILARSPSPPLQIELYSAFLDLTRTTTRERVTTAVKLAALLEQAGRIDEACTRLQALPQTPEVSAALERLYPQAERWGDLATLLRARLEQAPESRTPLLRRLAQTLETGLRDLPGATDAWRAVLEAEPEDLGAVRALCRLLEAQKRWPELVEMSERELALCEDRRQQAYILFRMGSLQETQLGQADAAGRNYRRALELDPRCFPALHGLRELAAAAGQWVAVIQFLAREVDLWDEPRERASVLARIGEIHEVHLGDRDAALQHYRHAVDIYPACLPAVRALADDAVARERWEEAAPYLQVLSNQNLDKWPRAQRAEVFARRGLVALRLGRTIEATECLKIALELSPDHLDALTLLVEAQGHARQEVASQELLGRLATAEAAASKAEDTSRHARLVSLRGQVYRDLLDLDAAEACLTEAARLRPHSLAVLRPLVDLYLATRRWSEATRVLRRYTERADIDTSADPIAARVEALLWEGEIWSDFAVDPGRALECYRRVLNLDDSHQDALFRMAQCQYLQGRYHDARESMHMLLAVADESRAAASSRAQYRYYLGRIQQVGFQDHGAAVSDYEAAVALDPGCAAASLSLLRLWEGQGQKEQVDGYLEAHPEVLQLPEKPMRAAGLLLAYVARIRQDRGDRTGAKAVLISLTEREGPTTRDARFALVRMAQGLANPAEATEQLTRILERDICDVEALRALADLVQRHGDEERLFPVLSALELLRALTPEEDSRFQALRERARKALERPVRPPPDALLARHLHHPAFESPIVSVIGPLDPALVRQFGARPLPAELRRVDRLLLPGEVKLVQALTGFRTFEVAQSPDVAELVALFPGDRPTVVLGEAAGAAEISALHRRFAVMRAVALARHGLARLHDLDTERAVELLRLLESLFTPSADGSERGESLLDAVPKKVAEQLRPEIEKRRQGTLPALYTGESALIGVMRTADRYGLLACGELRPAIEVLARSGGALEFPAGADLTWAIRGRSRLQDLVKYAISESYHTLRRGTGLGVAG